jgi:hypothetical protein
MTIDPPADSSVDATSPGETTLAQASEAVQALRGLDPSYSLHSFNTRYPGRGTAFAARCALARAAAWRGAA